MIVAAEIEFPRICSGCGYVELAKNDRHGLCAPCREESRQIREAKQTRRDVEARRAEWRRRTQKKRALDRLRPAEPCPPWADPLQLAEEALAALGRLKSSGALIARGERPWLINEVRELEKLILWLAHGPDAEGEA